MRAFLRAIAWLINWYIESRTVPIRLESKLYGVNEAIFEALGKELWTT